MTKITFPGRVGFHQEIKQRVQNYFEQNHLSPHADWRMVLKTVGLAATPAGAA